MKSFAVFGVLMAIVIILGSISMAETDDQIIPDWVWLVSDFWKKGEISDTEFINAISFLTEKKIVNLSDGQDSISLEAIVDNFGEKVISKEFEPVKPQPPQEFEPVKPQPIWVMKDLSLDVTSEELKQIKDAGFDIVSTSWGVEQDPLEARKFFDNAEQVGLKVITDAGFSYYAWGYTDEDWLALKAKPPVWQKELVQNWVKTLKDHPAIYAWDISNEAGENFPTAKLGLHDVHDSITLEQLRQATEDVLEIDSTRPLLIRMHPWDISKPSFWKDNPFEKGLADIVMLNIYSNFVHDGKSNPNLIDEFGQFNVDEILSVDPDTKVWFALAVFEEEPTFKRPTPDELRNDIQTSLRLDNVEGIGFYRWSHSNFGEMTSLTEIYPDLWDTIKTEMKKELE